jgi:crotonobetainyl-CoA:carnitine CoA-transferase CaiB-like acyl-CoA transferase
MILTGPATLDYTVNGRGWRREGMPPGNRASEPAVAPHNTYRCAGDDRWLAIAVTNDAEWQALVRAMDEPAWAADARFATNAGRLTHQDELDAQISAWTAPHDDLVLMTLLQAAGVRAAACQRASDRFERDPQLAVRDWWHRLPHAELGDCEYDGIVPKLANSPGALRTASPLMGEHTWEVLRDVLGLTDDEIAAHEASGVLM